MPHSQSHPAAEPGPVEPGHELLPLTVTVPADDWANTRQRVSYLETLLVGVAEQSGLDVEWYDVEKLAGLWGDLGRRVQAPVNVPLNTVLPAWVMPLMRLLRGEAGGDLAEAWAALPFHLPPGVTLPTETEAATVLLYHGLV